MAQSDSARRRGAKVRELPGDLAGLDALGEDGEAIAVFCFRDVRPLHGVAGYLDWRLSGGLSEPLQRGVYTGDPEETMLIPTRGRFGRRRLFMFGLGTVEGWDEGRLASAVRHAAEVMKRAGAREALFAAPHGGRTRDPGGRIGAAFARAVGAQTAELALEVAGILASPSGD